MTNNPIPFNYIITIHDKESILQQVMLQVIACMGINSTAYPVLDGCRDNSESIIDQLIIRYPQKKIVKIYADDVHELRSINKGLSAVSQEGRGYNIILQDDVLLKTHDIEAKVSRLYNERPNLGIVSFRQGGNISRVMARKKTAMPMLTDFIENIKGHNYNPFSVLQQGCFTYREVVIKSPICIPFEVIKKAGMPDESYAPWDDLAYCYTVLQAGFDNGVYALDIRSDVDWGTTRSKIQKVSVSEVEKKNISIFKTRHGKELANWKKRKIYNNKIYRIDSGPKAVHEQIGFISGAKSMIRSKLVYLSHILLKK